MPEYRYSAERIGPDQEKSPWREILEVFTDVCRMDRFTTSLIQFYSRQELIRDFLLALDRRGNQSLYLEDLAPADAFHIGGRQTTRQLAGTLGISPDMKVLDIGCGIGGTARFLAAEYGCSVIGIDLLEEYVQLARILSEKTGFRQRTRFFPGNALELPFEGGVFDLLWTEHVQMNLASKKTFFSEVCRVLKGKGRFAFYEIYARNGEELTYPLPWASSPAESFLISPETNEQYLHETGFRLLQTKEHTKAAPAAIRQLLNKIRTRSLPPLHLGLLMGEQMEVKLNNLLQGIETGQLQLLSAVWEKAES